MAETTKSAQEAIRAASSPISTEQPVTGVRASGAAAAAGQARERSAPREPAPTFGLSSAWEQAMNYSRANPGKATLIVFGVGLGAGLLMANGFTTRNRARRIVPPVMNALSEIASELFC